MANEGNLAPIDLLLLNYKMVEWEGSGVGWAGGTVEMLVKGWVISAGRSNKETHFAPW